LIGIRYFLCSYLEGVARWSPDAIRLYDLGNAHVVFENGFIESFKDAFLSSNSGGGTAGMQQLQGGMGLVPKAFISPDRGSLSLADNITFNARVTNITDLAPATSGPFERPQIRVDYETLRRFSIICATALRIAIIKTALKGAQVSE
jgi:monoamine oxidase